MSTTTSKNKQEAKRVKCSTESHQSSTCSSEANAAESPCPSPSPDVLSALADIKNNMVSSEMLHSGIESIKQELIRVFDEKFQIQDGKIFELQQENDGLKMEVKRLRKQCENDKDLLTALHSSSKRCENNINDLEQYGRRSIIRVWGIPEDTGQVRNEDCSRKIVELLRNRLGMDISAKDIDAAHRVGKPPDDWSRPRAIIVKFLRRFHKLEAIRLRKRLKNSQYVIREDLTKENQGLLLTTQECVEVTSAWSSEGKIFAKTFDFNIHRINCAEDIERMKERILATPGPMRPGTTRRGQSSTPRGYRGGYRGGHTRDRRGNYDGRFRGGHRPLRTAGDMNDRADPGQSTTTEQHRGRSRSPPRSMRHVWRHSSMDDRRVRANLRSASPDLPVSVNTEAVPPLVDSRPTGGGADPDDARASRGLSFSVCYRCCEYYNDYTTVTVLGI